MTDKKITLEKAQFILQKSEGYLNELVNDSKYIDGKISTTRNFLIIGIAAMLSTLNFVHEPFLTSIIGLISGFCICLGILTFASQAAKGLTLGQTSDELLKIRYNEEDLCLLILSYLSPHKECVECGRKINSKKANLYNLTLFVILIFSVISSAIIAINYFL